MCIQKIKVLKICWRENINKFLIKEVKIFNFSVDEHETAAQGF
jgi:hypothetical protein